MKRGTAAEFPPTAEKTLAPAPPARAILESLDTPVDIGALAEKEVIQ